MAFDIDGARKAGYSDAEIADHLAKSSKFDATGARKAGYSDAEILQHLIVEKPQASSASEESRLGRLTSPAGKEMVKREATALLSPLRGLKDVADTGAELLAKGYDKITGADKNLTGLVTGQPQGEYARVKAANEAAKAAFTEQTSGSPVAAVGRVAGNIAATGPVGGVLATLVRAVAPRVATSLASGGFSTGAAVAPNLAAKAADMGIRVAGGATTGGATAAMIDPDSAPSGAVIGAVLPPVAKVAHAAGRGIAALTPRGGQQRAVERVAETIGAPNVRQAIGDIQTYYPRGAETIPVSAAGVTQNPAVARLEQASRLRSSPAWYEFDQRQGKAVADNVQRVTSEADELSARFNDRAQNWADNWAKASNNIKPRVFAKRMGDLYGDLQQAKASPDAVNADVAAVLKEVEDTVMKFGKGFTPEHLQKLRAEFNGKVKPMAKTAMQSAPRDNPAVKSLIAELDDILNATTSGKWDKVRQGYAQDSSKVHAAKASQIVRNAFIDPDTGIVRKAADAAGDVPRVTEAGLMRAIEAARRPDKTNALSLGATQGLEATLNALRRQNIVQGVKRSASAGGGSDTIGNALSLGADAVVPSGVTHTLLRELLAGGRRVATGRIDDAMANLLANPDDLALALDALARRQPNQLAAVPYRVAPVMAADRR